MDPPLGSIRRVMRRAVVDLPQPLSPTSPRVSPGLMKKLMSSTAFRVLFRPPRREMRSLFSGKCLVRFLTSRK